MAIEQRFTELPAAGTSQLTDIICAVQGFVDPSNLGLSTQQTLQQVSDLFQSNTIKFNAGNPNGAVAGSTFQLCWDTVDKILWVCTTTGTSSTAVWTKSIQLIAGTGITINQAGATITISNSSASVLSWNEVLGTSQALVSNNAYVANNAGTVTFTLPATSSFGDIIFITGKGAGQWTITYGAGQSIQVGSVSSTITTGSLTSTNPHDAINLVCTVANLTWQAFTGTQGILTYV
jgi:hypothetical protein